MGFRKMFRELAKIQKAAERENAKAQRAIAKAERQKQVIINAAQRMIDVTNESIRMAQTSKKLSTRISRLYTAKIKVSHLKQYILRYPFIYLKSLDEFEAGIESIENELRKDPKFAVEEKKYLDSLAPDAWILK